MEVIDDHIRTDLGILDRYAKILDSSIRIPGTNKTFGIDPILGLIPGIGSIIGYGFSVLILLKTLQLGASKMLLAKMFFNITLDSIIGAIPILGTLFDFVYKANERNLTLFREYHDEGKHRESTLPYFIALAFLCFSVVFAISFLTYHIITSIF